VTHGHARPQVACALYSLVIRRLLKGDERASALASARGTLRETYSARPNGHDHLAALDHLEAWTGRAGRGRVWDSFWSAWDALAGAGSYQETIERAVRYGNDTDTTACIAGGMAGAYRGIDAIPPDWRSGMRGQAIARPLVARLIADAGYLTSTSHPLRIDWVDLARAPKFADLTGRLGMTFLPGKCLPGQAGHHWRDLVLDAERLRDHWHVDTSCFSHRTPNLKSRACPHLSPPSWPRASRSCAIRSLTGASRPIEQPSAARCTQSSSGFAEDGPLLWHAWAGSAAPEPRLRVCSVTVDWMPLRPCRRRA
jgi:hypothetical protein